MVGRQHRPKSALQAHCFPAEFETNLLESPWWKLPATTDFTVYCLLGISWLWRFLLDSESLDFKHTAFVSPSFALGDTLALESFKRSILLACTAFLFGPGFVSISPQRISNSMSKLFLDMSLTVILSIYEMNSVLYKALKFSSCRPVNWLYRMNVALHGRVLLSKMFNI